MAAFLFKENGQRLAMRGWNRLYVNIPFLLTHKIQCCVSSACRESVCHVENNRDGKQSRAVCCENSVFCVLWKFCVLCAVKVPSLERLQAAGECSKATRPASKLKTSPVQNRRNRTEEITTKKQFNRQKDLHDLLAISCQWAIWDRVRTVGLLRILWMKVEVRL